MVINEKMATKEIKSLLKSARTAFDRQEYEETIKHCEAVLWSDSNNYLAHILAGKANLSLGNIGKAKEHYVNATAIDEKQILAWKGLVDLYDKHNTDGTETDIRTALLAYETVLPLQNDDAKKITVISKLIMLYKKLKINEKACLMYDMLLVLCPPLNVMMEGILFLLQEGLYSNNRWLLLKDSYSLLIEGVAKTERIQLINGYINGLMKWVKLLDNGYNDIVDHIKEQCQILINDEETRLLSINTLCITELWAILETISRSDRCKPHPLNDYQRSIMGEGTELSDSYKAIELITNNKTIKEACLLADRGVRKFPTVCEYWVVACLCHMTSHNYHMTINNANEGLKYLFEAPLFLQEVFRKILHICLIEALISNGQFDKALTTIEKECSQMSCDNHVTELHIRALLGCNRIQEAEQIASSSKSDSNVAVQLWKSLISMATCDYVLAAIGFQHCVKVVPTSPWYLYNLGACLLSCSNGDKKQSYQCLIKSAQLDPFNPYVFEQLGHYHRNITKDLNRAAKCYQKSFSTLCGPVTAGLILGEIYTILQDQEGAFNVYNEVINRSSPSQCKEAWLRVGLYHRRHNCYEEAIKCFLAVLRQDSTDSHVWECIGEAYQMRGSQNSSLKSFMRAIEVNPKSLYCQYQIASIHHLLGLSLNAINGYTIVLEIDQNYVPALKDRAEVYYNLAQDSLDDAFDQKAVDYVTLALKDLSIAISHCSTFVSLWKLSGDCCLSLSPIHPNLVNIDVSSLFLSGNHGDLAVNKTINKLELLQLAISCYSNAIQLTKDHTHLSSLLHNMSLAYKAIAKDNHNELQNLSTSLELSKKAVSLSPSNHHYWNTLGVIASHPVLATPSLAQHCFIKSVAIEHNNAVAWSNLGSLYLINSNVELAHSAFEKAQSCDPTHVVGWVGDGLVAETIGKSNEAMNFFHISSERKYHPESAIGFAQWVCHNLVTSDKEDILSPSTLSLNKSTHFKTIQARDGLQKYILRNPNDPTALNLLGLLYEQEGLVKLAEQSVNKARQLLMGGANNVGVASDDLKLTVAMKNHARLLRSCGDMPSSLATYEILNDTGVPLLIDHALSLHMAGKFYESFTAYEQMMTTNDVMIKPYLILAGAMSLFGYKNTEDCKSRLFKVFQTPPPIVHGLISLAVFAGYLNDTTLLQATLNEINQRTVIDHTSINRLHPSCYRVLRSLYHFLSNNNQNTELLESLIDKFPVSDHYKPLPVMQDVLKIIIYQTADQSLYTIQKIIRNFPNNIWAWSLLSYVLLVLGRTTEAKSCLQLTTFKAKQLSESIQADSKLLQLKTNSLQTIQLLLAWCRQLHVL